jgi:nitrogen-specific signal transduction histidine kinase
LSKQSDVAESSNPHHEELQAALKMVSLYSHQIKNYVTVIVGNSELVRDVVPDHTSMHRMKEILDSAHRIACITEKMLSLKIEE